MAEKQGPGCPDLSVQGPLQGTTALGTATSSSSIGWDAPVLEHSSGCSSSSGAGVEQPWQQAAEQAQRCGELDLTEPPETPVRASGSDWNFRRHFAAGAPAAGSVQSWHSSQEVEQAGEEAEGVVPAAAAVSSVARQAAEQALTYGWRPGDAVPAGGTHCEALAWHQLLPQAPPDRPAVALQERRAADGGSTRKGAAGRHGCACLGSMVRRLWKKAAGRPAEPGSRAPDQQHSSAGLNQA